MIQQNDKHATEHVRTQIQSAFPNIVYVGRVTPGDGKTGDEYDENQALFDALHGKAWADIPASFIRANASALVLLTEEAFVVYLPAWLTEGLADREIGDAVVYAFSPDPGEDLSYMGRRIQRLNQLQKETLGAFLACRVQSGSSLSVQERARRALAYVSTFL